MLTVHLNCHASINTVEIHVPEFVELMQHVQLPITFQSVVANEGLMEIRSVDAVKTNQSISHLNLQIHVNLPLVVQIPCVALLTEDLLVLV